MTLYTICSYWHAFILEQAVYIKVHQFKQCTHPFKQHKSRTRACSVKWPNKVRMFGHMRPYPVHLCLLDLSSLYYGSILLTWISDLLLSFYGSRLSVSRPSTSVTLPPLNTYTLMRSSWTEALVFPVRRLNVTTTRSNIHADSLTKTRVWVLLSHKKTMLLFFLIYLFVSTPGGLQANYPFCQALMDFNHTDNAMTAYGSWTL
jgi:hypothetical protein